MPPVLLLTGATGFLGARLQGGLAARWRVVGTVRGEAGAGAVALDLLDADSIARAFERVRPAAVVHTAAISDPDACERDPALARRANVAAVEVLASLCAKAGARLIHFSTDYVFDGLKDHYREEDVVRPLSVYGQTKLDSEAAVLSFCPDAAVLRVSNCYGRPLGAKRTYLDQWHARLRAGEPVKAFTDQWRTPTPGDQVPAVVDALLGRRDLRGIFHWGGADRTTRHEAALAYCRVMGFDERLVEAARAADHAFLAARPRDSSLDSSRLASALGVAPIGLREGFAGLSSARS